MSSKKELKKKYGKEAEVYVGDGFDIVIKWDLNARRDELIKFVPHEGVQEIVIPVERLVSTIIDNFAINHMYAMDARVKQIDMIEVGRTIKGVCEKDFKVGDEISFTYKHQMPLEYAIAEEAIGISKIQDMKVRTVTRDYLDKAAKNIAQGVREYNDQVHAEYLKRKKESQSESTQDDPSVESSVD